MLGLRIIRDFLFFRMMISWRIHSPASDPSLGSDASKLSIILFKLFIYEQHKLRGGKREGMSEASMQPISRDVGADRNS